MLELEAYKNTLDRYGEYPVLAAWVGGSHSHGLADEHSDLDLRLIIQPSREDVLLGEADWTRSGHEPDVTVMTPLAVLKRLLAGAPNLLEALTLPKSCILWDTGLLGDLSRIAAGLTTCRTVDGALGNARSNLHQLESGRDFEERKRRKLMAETLRLLYSVDYVTGHEERGWPARVDEHVPELRKVKAEGTTLDVLHKHLDRTTTNTAEHARHDLSGYIKQEATSMIVNLHAGVVECRTFGTGMDAVEQGLEEFAKEKKS